MSEREEVLNEFGTAECVKRDDCTHFDCVAERKMADEIVRLRSALTTAERERDEARRERDEFRIEWDRAMGYWSKCGERIAQLEQIAETQRLVLKGMHERAERAELVVEAAKAFVGAERTDNMALLLNALSSSVRALDEADGTP